MLRCMENPPNPYETEYRQWLEPPPAAQVEVYEERARSILSENDSPDIGFRWSVNPYRGCQHACAYCYARPTHEYLNLGAGTDFETKLIAKVNAPELLRAAFSRRGWQGESVCFSGVTDCYQPIEASYGLTRRCLEVCREFANPVSIVTKGCLVLRDAGLLAELNRVAEAVVFVSVAFADDATARSLEPQAPPPSRRMEAIRALAAAGVPVGVMVAPIIPGLNDKEIPTILRRAAESGARTAAYVPLRLPGSVAPVFLSRLHEAMPQRARRIESRIREMRGGRLNDPRFGKRMKGEGPYWESIRSLFRVTAQRCGLSLGAYSAAEPDPSSGERPDSAGLANAIVNRPAAELKGNPPEPSRVQQLRFDFTQ